MKIVNILLVFLTILCCDFVAGLECAGKFMKISLLKYRAETKEKKLTTDLHNEIRLLNEYQFNCSSTNITSVILGIQVRLPTNNRTLFPSIQLWRLGDGNSGQYRVVDERMIYYSTSNVSTSGVFEYPLNPPITANPGDILAVSQPNNENSIIRIFYKEDTGLSFKSRTVRFGANSDNRANQPLQTHQLILVYPITDHCINSSVNSSIIKQYALTVTDTSVFNAEGQYIYPEINFTCNGTITKWIFGGENQTNEQFYLTPELQIWRKRNDSKYMKVGNSSILDYTNISTNVYELVPKSPLKFQQGDFFGVYIPDNTKTLFKLYEQRNNGPVNLKVEGNIEEPQSITLRTVGNDYPLVTIETDQTDSSLITVYITISIVLTLVLLVVSMVIICVIGCRKYMKTSGSLRGVQGQDNPLYDSNDHSKPIKAIYESFSAVYISIESSLEASELLANEEIHQPVEYEVPETSNNKKKIEGKHVNSHDERYDNPVITQVCNHSPRENFFIEEEIYWEPGSDTESIYEQISKKNYRIIARQDITITKYLGSGEFGTVNQGIWNSPHGPIDVAIKMLNKKAAEEGKVLFLREGAIMGQFHHPNIVKIHGMVTVGEPTMIVLELITQGDLREYLQKYQMKRGRKQRVSITLSTLLLEFSKQIASGMKYLSDKNFVHRDLAARNILVTDQGICKISDFGMSRDLQDENYYISQAKKIPIKWTAPEALRYKRYSTASDVWSFGAVLYEVWSVGHKPFEFHENKEYLRLVDSGYRLPPPAGCPRLIYQLMIECWHPNASCRPPFDIILRDLKQLDINQCNTSGLGGPLQPFNTLYADLQATYKHN